MNNLLVAGCLLLSLLAVAAARSGAAWALGIRGITFFFGVFIENKDAVTLWRRVVVVLAGVLVSYLVPVLFFVVSLCIGGTEIQTTEVGVVEGRPAATAGMVSGDRVLRVGGQPVATFQDITRVISARAAQPTEIVVARGAEELHFQVLPESQAGQGRIGIRATTSRWIPVSIGAALTRGIAVPWESLSMAVETFVFLLSDQNEVKAGGPVAVVREAPPKATHGLASLLALCGFLLSYWWPAAVIVSIATVPRRKHSRAS